MIVGKSVIEIYNSQVKRPIPLRVRRSHSEGSQSSSRDLDPCVYRGLLAKRVIYDSLDDYRDGEHSKSSQIYLNRRFANPFTM